MKVSNAVAVSSVMDVSTEFLDFMSQACLEFIKKWS